MSLDIRCYITEMKHPRRNRGSRLVPFDSKRARIPERVPSSSRSTFACDLHLCRLSKCRRVQRVLFPVLCPVTPNHASNCSNKTVERGHGAWSTFSRLDRAFQLGFGFLLCILSDALNLQRTRTVVISAGFESNLYLIFTIIFSMNWNERASRIFFERSRALNREENEGKDNIIVPWLANWPPRDFHIHDWIFMQLRLKRFV